MALKPITAISSIRDYLLKPVLSWAVVHVTKPVRIYSPSEVSNIKALKKRLRPGDVLLIAGNARISHVVKVLTLSQWSHVVLYVGDRRDLLSEEEVEEWSGTFGYTSLKHLIVDADPVRGVHLKPIDEHVGLNIRHCRPEALSSADIGKVLDIALSEIGKQYDIHHIFRLLWFFTFPWEMFPESIKRLVTDFTLSESETICSRVLSEAFHSVGYPVRPVRIKHNRPKIHVKALGVATGMSSRGKSFRALLRGGRVKSAFSRLGNKRYVELQLRGPRYVTPADYDLSRFFSIIKDPDDLKIDYKNARAMVAVTAREV